MNSVSIIINGVRYDAVEAPKAMSCNICCDLYDVCERDFLSLSDFCLGLNEEKRMCFKKSIKKLSHDQTN